MTYTYCEKFGFNTEKRAQWLALLALGEADLRLAHHLHNKAVAPHIDDLVEQFYAFLLQAPTAQTLLARGFSLERLKNLLRDYLMHLGLNFTEPAYFERQLRTGLVLVWAGVDLSVYQGGYRLLQQLLIDHVPKTSSRYNALVAFVLKITFLDLSLAVEAYHNVQLHGLEQSLEALRGRQSELRNRIRTDALTGVLNREHALMRLNRMVREAHENESPLCVIMADLDHFKRVNDSHGHLVGDQVLRDVSARLQRGVRGGDIIGRYGGEEFVIVLRSTGLERAHEIAERLRVRVDATPINAAGIDVPMSISQGIAQLAAGEKVEELLARADRALYAAKGAGRNRVEIDGVASRG